jgi:hypothetical protein
MFGSNCRLDKRTLMGIRFAVDPATGIDDGVADAGTGTEPDDFKVHPAWDKALEAVPDVIRKPIIEQIRTSEREHQAAIEAARTGSVEPEWRDFTAAAKGMGLTTAQLADAYNSQTALQQAIVDDPDAFEAQLHDQIEEMVSSGQLTRKQGQQAHAQAAGVDGELLTPEQQEIAELRQLIQQNEARWDGVDAALDSQAEQEAADEYGQQFLSDLNHDMGAAFGVDVNGRATASQESMLAVARIAASILDSDATEQITNQQAIAEGVRQLTMAAVQFGAPAPAGQPVRATFPVGGGTNGTVQQPPAGFKDDNERKAAMLNLAAQLNSAG